jgi:hypothetical protein
LQNKKHVNTPFLLLDVLRMVSQEYLTACLVAAGAGTTGSARASMAGAGVSCLREPAGRQLVMRYPAKRRVETVNFKLKVGQERPGAGGQIVIVLDGVAAIADGVEAKCTRSDEVSFWCERGEWN